jgi:uncharacterized membrane protein
MNNYFTFDKEDKKLWLGIAGVGIIFIVVFSIFTTTSPFLLLEKFFAAVLEMFLPGYVIMKLFFDNISFSENRIADRAIVSVGLSIATMVTTYFLTTYLRPYVFNTDERGMEFMSGNVTSLLLLATIIGVSFGIKYYQNKKKGIS